MKIYTSYFYNIRFFKPWQIPVSTAVWDPKWFHDGKGKDHVWKDQNNVWNGIRFEALNPEGCNAGGCPCKVKNPEECWFLRSYAKGLRSWKFSDIMDYLQKVADFIQQTEGFQEEPEIILMVYEVPDNPCSERVELLRYFRENGIDIEEWKKN